MATRKLRNYAAPLEAVKRETVQKQRFARPLPPVHISDATLVRIDELSGRTKFQGRDFLQAGP